VCFSPISLLALLLSGLSHSGPPPIPLKVAIGVRSHPAQGGDQRDEPGEGGPDCHDIPEHVEANDDDDGQDDGEDAPQVDGDGLEGL
jgi:hypothetical protein